MLSNTMKRVAQRTMEALIRAIKLAGSQQALADRINQWLPPAEQIGQSAVSEWLRRGRVPGEKVILIARAVDHAVLPHELRADLYPHPEDGLPAARRVGLVSESRRPSVAEILGPFEKELREDEYNAVRVALERGDGDLFRIIKTLSAPVDVREQLLKAANLTGGSAA